MISSKVPEASTAGSPPHAWGQYDLTILGGLTERFTPTCVGTMPKEPDFSTLRPVHPHMRGDNPFPDAGDHVADGSPPHAWGQCRRWPTPFRSTRFTPTCVGTIGSTASRWAWTPVHPHMRGDNSRVISAVASMLGSPPHAWGQWAGAYHRRNAARFTPTCVGTMEMGRDISSTLSVHPHMRGDNAAAHCSISFTRGSPPHALGQLRQSFRHGGSPPVHPHMRGDNSRWASRPRPS